MGADQGLYAYVGERILEGELPYVDAWDQKPPAIHYTYALMRAVWRSDAVVPAVDLAVAAAVAALLFGIARQLTSPAAGFGAAVIFLFLSNPAFTRLNGVRIRAQCETFIALAVTAALALLLRRRRGAYAAAGVLLGAAFMFKYNAAVYAAAVFGGLWWAGDLTLKRAAALAGGACAVPAAFLLVFSGALIPFYDATVAYNLQYSGETYDGLAHFVTYLLTFPVDRARDDALWTLGGGACAVLLAGAVRDRSRLIPVAWVAAACLSIAINGSRGLPQYFVQAGPALALAGAWACWILAGHARSAALPAPARRVVLAVALVLVGVAIWRVNQFDKLVEQTAFDARYALGGMPRDVHLARYADPRKYSALGAARVAAVMQQHSDPGTPVYLFGFAGAAYVYAERPSASRFFWSRPVIAGFNAGQPGYGAGGLLADLERSRPAVIALQQHDWAPDVDDSADYFMRTPPLASWLRSQYRQTEAVDGFDVWVRRE